MKVIGKVDGDVYICEVRHAEIEKFMNLYYNNMRRLSVGDVVDLGKGHDFCEKTRRALEKTEEFISANKDVIEMIVTGVSVMARSNE